MKWLTARRCTVAACGLLAACAAAQLVPETIAAEAEERGEERLRYDLGPAYLGGALPDGETLAPPPPAAGSVQMELDRATNASALAMRGSERWELAARDADLGPDWYGRAFSCSAGVRLSGANTPHIARLVRRAALDFGRSTGAVKDLYQRRRPFLDNGAPICTPGEEDALRDNGSYPSGHAAIGYGTGLVLASLFPDRAASLLARGNAFADSRWVCNVHWRSDAAISQAFAGAVHARLQSNPEYRADYAAALEEAGGLSQMTDDGSCVEEARALSGAGQD